MPVVEELWNNIKNRLVEITYKRLEEGLAKNPKIRELLEIPSVEKVKEWVEKIQETVYKLPQVTDAWIVGSFARFLLGRILIGKTFRPTSDIDVFVLITPYEMPARILRLLAYELDVLDEHPIDWHSPPFFMLRFYPFRIKIK